MRTVAALAMVFAFCAFQPQAEAQEPKYTLRVDVVERVAKAINYRHRNGATTIDFRGTSLQPGSRGEAKVESKQGYVEIEVEFDNMIPANRYGREYLTYVMWAVTPQGRPTNLGEVILNGTKSKLNVTTELQAFGMIVTAEPYFAVTQPSDRVVLENRLRADTIGKVEEMAVRYELIEKGQFAFDKMPADKKPSLIETSLPLDLQQAENAVRIAEWFGADRHAPDVMSETRDLLFKAEEYYVRKAMKPMSMTARQTVQNAEDARLVAMRRSQDAAMATKAGEVEREHRELRDRLVKQLNRVLQTRETRQGVVVNVSEDLFESGKSILRAHGREKLAKIAGLMLAHPGVRLDIEGSSLSRRRADAVRSYLQQQGISGDLLEK